MAVRMDALSVCVVAVTIARPNAYSFISLNCYVHGRMIGVKRRGGRVEHEGQDPCRPAQGERERRVLVHTIFERHRFVRTFFLLLPPAFCEAVRLESSDKNMYQV